MLGTCGGGEAFCLHAPKLLWDSSYQERCFPPREVEKLRLWKEPLSTLYLDVSSWTGSLRHWSIALYKTLRQGHTSHKWYRLSVSLLLLCGGLHSSTAFACSLQNSSLEECRCW